MKIELSFPITTKSIALNFLHQAIEDHAAFQQTSLVNQPTGQVSKQRIKQLMDKGAIWLSNRHGTHRLRRVKKILWPGEVVHLYYNAKVLDMICPNPKLIADFGVYSVWDKPSRMLSQGSKYGDHCAINRWVEKTLKRNTFLVHRLDRGAQGLLILAHHKSAAAKLAALFRQRTIIKKYLVWVEGQLDLQAHLIDSPVDGKNAETLIQRCQFHADRSMTLLDVQIKTGRKHQIRRHLAELGHPVVGDRLYGYQPMTNANDDLKLKSYYLAFDCPITLKRQEFQLDQDEFN